MNDRRIVTILGASLAAQVVMAVLLVLALQEIGSLRTTVENLDSNTSSGLDNVCRMTVEVADQVWHLRSPDVFAQQPQLVDGAC